VAKVKATLIRVALMLTR